MCVHLLQIIKSSRVVNSIPEKDEHGTRLSDMDTRFFWEFGNSSDSDTDKVVDSDTDTGSESQMFYNDINFENLSNLGHDIVHFGDHNMTVSFNQVRPLMF